MTLLVSRVARGAAALCLFTFLFSAAIAADPPRVDIAAHIAAGEFGPAIAAAGKLAPAERDKWLREIALAQSRAGARSAASDTLASMASDKNRLEAVQELRQPGAQGGAAAADFDSLIDLITSTVHPETWKDTGTGEGTIAPFPTGVYVDADGLLKRRPIQPHEGLDEVRNAAVAGGSNRDVMKASNLRKISLTRLEREVQLLHAQGKAPSDAMQNLAGLTRIQYVLVYPESGDIVIAGPAGAWNANEEGRMVSAESGEPVAQLDDLVVVLRNSLTKDAKFGCAITPREENLAKLKSFVTESSKTPLKPGGRDKWAKSLRDNLGRQDIEVWGIDPRTHAAHILVEADYHMKLVGMGLEDGTLNVKSYLDTVEVGPKGELPPMNVLRWWFTLNYDAVSATKSHDAFALKGPGAKVLSENEMLTERGQRVHTGASDDLNSRFAHSFTKNFETLADKYPVYAELRNIFDMALVAGLIRSQDLSGQVGWHMTHFGPEGAYEPRLDEAPKEVDSIVNYRVVRDKHIVAGISGGVEVNAKGLVSTKSLKTDDYGALSAQRANSVPKSVTARGWWWD